MKTKGIAGGILLAGFVTGAAFQAFADGEAPHSRFWANRAELFAVPKSWPAEGAVSGPVPEGLRAAFLEGLPFKGHATRFFVYWGVPAGARATNAVPGMVLVHGGGGSAFANWVKFWNDRGYAAISMDLNGRVSGDLGNTSHVRHAWAGPGAVGCGGFDLLKERPEDQWMYHAVADVVKSHSFLRAQPGVDPDRIGMTGVSWGGVVNCVVASVDDRFRFAIPVYGCGFLFEPFSSWTHRYGGMDAKVTRKRKKGWSPLWDPMNYLPLAKIPVHWLNGTNDGNFSLPSLQASYDLVPTEKSLSLRVRMGHSHGKVSEQAIEVVSYADALLKGAPALPKVGRPVLSGGCLSASFSQDDRLPVASAVLDFTADDSFCWYSNRWKSVSAQVSGGRAWAAVPPMAKWAYLSVKTTNAAVVSSSVLDLRKP